MYQEAQAHTHEQTKKKHNKKTLWAIITDSESKELAVLKSRSKQQKQNNWFVARRNFSSSTHSIK